MSPKYRWANALHPSKANGALLLETQGAAIDGGAQLTVRAEGAGIVDATVSDGVVVYENAIAGKTMLQRATFDGAEDFVVLPSAPAAKTSTYDVTLGAQLVALRLVESTLEFLDSKGVPQLRMNPPFVRGSDKRWSPLAVAVRGCAYDTDPRPSKGRVLAPAGASHCLVDVTLPSSGVAYPALLDPAWVSVGSLAVAREKHALVALGDGKALAIGGADAAGAATASVERYDEPTGTWSATSSLPVARSSPLAVLLRDGRVLVAGGRNAAGVALASTAIFDPSTSTWSAGSSMGSARADFSLTRTPTGRVLAVGGVDAAGVPTDTVELFDPVSGTWAAQQALPYGPRASHASALHLQYVCASGGWSGSSIMDTMVCFDESTGFWSGWPSLGTPRMSHTLNALGSAKLLAAGGVGSAGALASTELYDAAGPFSWASTQPFVSARFGHTATTDALGRVFLVGGSDGADYADDVTRVLPDENVFAALPTLDPTRALHATVYLSNGNLLVAGGRTSTGVIASAREYPPEQPEPGQTAGLPAVTVEWPTTFQSGTKSATTNLQVVVRNRRPHSITYSLSWHGAGLDFRENTRSAGSFSVAANATRTHNLVFNQLPVQSVGSDSSVAVIAQVTGAGCSGCEQLNVKVTSHRLFHQFNSAYSQVTIKGYQPTAMPTTPLGTYTTFDGLLTALKPTFDSLEVLTGRLYTPGVGYQGLGSLPPSPTNDPLVTYKGGTFLPASKVSRDLANLMDLWAPISETDGFSFCPKLDNYFLDDDLGEAISGDQARQIPFAYAFVHRYTEAGVGETVWKGRLNLSGCTERILLEGGKSYVISALSRFDDGTTQVNLTNAQKAGAFYNPWWAVSIAPYPPGTQRNIDLKHAYSDDYVMSNLASSVAQIYYRSWGDLAAGAKLDVVANRTCSATVSACANAAGINIGKINEHAHNAQYKFVVAHEFGHAVQDTRGALMTPDYFQPEEGLPPQCTCLHLTTDNSHCLQSLERSSGAQVEGFAHFYAARSWNGTRVQSDPCSFNYYKAFREPSGLILQPPVVKTCRDEVRWRNNQCPNQAASLGVEWDWMNFFYAENVASPGALPVADLFSLYRSACGGVCGQTVASYNTLLAALVTRNGVLGPQTAAFENNGAAFGVNQ